MVTAKTKSLYFDRRAVVEAIGRARAAALAKAGAYVRRAARSSIRKSRKSAEPGSPPKSHTGLLRQGIQFSYDPRTQSVVVGPELIGRASRTGGPTIPNILERGGIVRAAADRNVRGRGRQRPRRIAKGTRVRYAPHPFMVPALEASLAKLPESIRNTIRA